MPESRTRKSASAKKQAVLADEQLAAARNAEKKIKSPGSRQWVPPTFITVGLLGVLWLVVYYLTASLGINIPVMSGLEGWNVLIGMGLMGASFGIATLWR